MQNEILVKCKYVCKPNLTCLEFWEKVHMLWMKTEQQIYEAAAPYSTFSSGGSRLWAGTSVTLPRRVAMAREVTQFEVADCQTYDRCLVQLARNGRRKRK